MKILVVDDDLMVKVAVKRWLEAHDVLFCVDLPQAQRTIHQCAIDLILCDLFIPPYLPGEVAAVLSATYPGIPLVRISCDEDNAIAKERDRILAAVDVVSQQIHEEIRCKVKDTITQVKSARALVEGSDSC